MDTSIHTCTGDGGIALTDQLNHRDSAIPIAASERFTWVHPERKTIMLTEKSLPDVEMLRTWPQYVNASNSLDVR